VKFIGGSTNPEHGILLVTQLMPYSLDQCNEKKNNKKKKEID